MPLIQIDFEYADRLALTSVNHSILQNFFNLTIKSVYSDRSQYIDKKSLSQMCDMISEAIVALSPDSD